MTANDILRKEEQLPTGSHRRSSTIPLLKGDKKWRRKLGWVILNRLTFLQAELYPPLIGISNTVDQAGVQGRNQHSGPGVVGASTAGDGVFGQGGHNGVVGRSKAANQSGVWADNTGGGHGITGTSDRPNGIGVFGRGKRLAGKFEGNVEITGKLSVGGQDIQSLIQALEQRVAKLEHPEIPAPGEKRPPK